jgi:hypothetical protein
LNRNCMFAGPFESILLREPPQNPFSTASVKPGLPDVSAIRPLRCRKRKFKRPSSMSQSCHVWTAPGWQGQSSRRRAWSVQPCIRPVSAVRMTAGHNAPRGSGPGQKLAFDDALALVGCPDRRISALRAVRLPNLHITPAGRRDLIHIASATGSL